MTDKTPARELDNEQVRLLKFYGNTPELREAAKWVLVNRERLEASERQLDEELGHTLED